MNTALPNLSLVVLCYKSGAQARKVVCALVDSFRACGIEDYELVLVGNYVEGSHDLTPQVVAQLAKDHPRVRYVVEEKNVVINDNYGLPGFGK